MPIGSKIKTVTKSRDLNITSYINESVDFEKFPLLSPTGAPRFIETSAQQNRKHALMGQSLELVGIRHITQLKTPQHPTDSFVAESLRLGKTATNGSQRPKLNYQ